MATSMPRRTVHGLVRQLTVPQMMALSIAGIGPFYSIFVVYGSIVQGVGTGILWIFFAAGIIAVANGLVFSHLSRYFPLAGGGYALVRQILGPGMGTIYVILSILNWVLVVAAFTTPTATFINTLHPVMPLVWLEVLLVVVMVALSLTNVRLSGVISVVFLAIELLFVIFWLVIGFTHLAVPWSVVLKWPRAVGAQRFGAPISAAALVAAMPSAIYSLAGYESSIHYTEEMIHFKRIIWSVTLTAAGAAVLYMLGMPLVLLTDRHFGAVMAASIPGESVLTHVFPGVAPLFLGYLIISSFNGGLVSYQEASRMLMNAARDGNFGSWLGRILGSTNQRGVPWVAILVWFIPTVAVILVAQLNAIFAFTGVTIMITYVMVSLAAIWFYLKAARPMGVKGGAFWAFPLIPMLVIVASLTVIVLQSRSYIWVSLAIVTAGAGLALAVGRKFRPATGAELVAASARAQADGEGFVIVEERG
ncbi:MAG: APC family permease [Firmicutes bacterium]|nr:APC family permease [Bacillota bacterium]